MGAPQVEPVVDHATAFEANIFVRPGCSIESTVVSGGAAIVKVRNSCTDLDVIRSSLTDMSGASDQQPCSHELFGCFGMLKGSCNGEKTPGAALTGPTIVSFDDSVKPVRTF